MSSFSERYWNSVLAVINSRPHHISCNHLYTLYTILDFPLLIVFPGVAPVPRAEHLRTGKAWFTNTKWLDSTETSLERLG